MKTKTNFILIIFTIILIILIVFLGIKWFSKEKYTQKFKKYSDIDYDYENILNIPSFMGSFIQNINNKKLHLNKTITNNVRKNLSPVIFIPGICGTQLMSSHTNWDRDLFGYSKSFPDCLLVQQSDGDQWLSNVPISPCTLNILKPTYDKNKNMLYTDTNTFISPTGNPSEGDLESTNCLNSTPPNCLFGLGGYAKNFFDLLKSSGYIEKTNLFALGYDWRLLPLGDINNYNTFSNKNNYIGNYFLIFKNIVETAYKNNNKKVFIVSHSLGSYINIMLINIARELSQKGDIEKNWVEKYINKLIFIAPALDGSSRLLQGITSGYNITGVPILSDSYFRTVERTLAGGLYLVPILSLSYGPKGQMIKVGDKNYICNDEIGEKSIISEFLKDCSKNNTDFKMILNLFNSMITKKILGIKDPGVPTLIFRGIGAPTACSFEFKNDNYKFNSQPIAIYTKDGDGLITSDSCSIPSFDINCTINGVKTIFPKWKDVEIIDINGKGDTSLHQTMMLSNTQIHNDILDIVAPN